MGLAGHIQLAPKLPRYRFDLQSFELSAAFPFYATTKFPSSVSHYLQGVVPSTTRRLAESYDFYLANNGLKRNFVDTCDKYPPIYA